MVLNNENFYYDIWDVTTEFSQTDVEFAMPFKPNKFLPPLNSDLDGIKELQLILSLNMSSDTLSKEKTEDKKNFLK